MQFYLNGYRPGDPDVHAAAPLAENRTAGLPDAVDVLIVGSGPARILSASRRISSTQAGDRSMR